jgi:tetratricopeptide (TPR) repeat protein
VEAGVPAVVTMQDLISTRSVAVLTPVFYAQLARHGEVDQALNAARGILATAQRPDATVPVLFMRLRHGRVWEEAARPEGVGAWLRAHLVPVLLAVLLILAGGAFGVWRALRPRPMRGEFNVAVAAFKQIPEDAAPVATSASQMIYDFLESEYDLSSFEDVEVRHGGVGVIAEAPEARALAEAINAHLVIYGTVTVVGDDALLSPKFFVAETFRADVGELNGQHQLALPVAFNVQDLIDYESAPNEKLRQKTAILTAFTKALAYLAADDLPLARDSIGTALAEAERYGEFEGQEVLYLFASDISRRSEAFEAAQAYLDQALDLNPNYARAYVAQANIYYDQDNLAQAFAAYQQALDIEDRAYGALIVEKANLGLGNIYVYQYAAASENAAAAPSELAALADLALAHYRVVLDAYEAAHSAGAARSGGARPQRRLRELAAQAAYFTGVVHEQQGDMAAARDAYRQARDLSASLPAPELNATVESQLESRP